MTLPTTHHTTQGLQCLYRLNMVTCEAAVNQVEYLVACSLSMKLTLKLTLTDLESSCYPDIQLPVLA